MAMHGLGCQRSPVIIRIRVEYEQYFIYGRANRKVNNAITFEQSVFSEIHVLKTFEVSSVGTTLDSRDQLSSD